jgi:ABC-type glycerol-3-phosphate transport system permease component
LSAPSAQKSARFDVKAIAATLPATATTLVVDHYLTDREAASARVFRVYKPTPPHAVAFGRFFGQRAFFNINIALMALPPVALVVPLFTLMVQAGLINKLPSVMLVYTGLLVPFSVFFLVNFFRELPLELIEAATIDGASHTRILLRIVMPLSVATTFTLVIVNTIWVWNELLFALVFLQDNDQRTVMAGLTLFQGRFATNEPLMMAGAFLSILPLLVLYLASQKFFIRGMTAGIGK